MLAMILAVMVQCIDGNNKIIHVSEFISHDGDFFTNGEDDNSYACCVYGNCTCNSLDHALANLTSNVVINITTDVTLSTSLIKVSDLQNVSINGHSNPTVNCKHFGGIHLTFCHNCIIQDITWDGCGAELTDNSNEPGIKFNYSSSVTIQNCCFQHSVGQALVLTEMSGYISINNCNFVNNSHYRGHGAAIHYLLHDTKKFPDSLFMFSINHCSFTNNRHIKSLVHAENRLFIKYHKIIFNNSMFNSNQSIPIRVINHEIHIYGKVLFQSNVAEDGAGIYISNYSTVIFGENSKVTFIQNLANDRGGAIFLKNYSNFLIHQNSVVTFKKIKLLVVGLYTLISTLI